MVVIIIIGAAESVAGKENRWKGKEVGRKKRGKEKKKCRRIMESILLHVQPMNASPGRIHISSRPS